MWFGLENDVVGLPPLCEQCSCYYLGRARKETHILEILRLDVFHVNYFTTKYYGIYNKFYLYTNTAQNEDRIESSLNSHVY